MTRRLDALVGDAEIEALFGDAADLAAMLRVEAALAAAQAEVGLIPAAAAERIATVCAAFVADENALRRGLAQDGVVVPALVAQLRTAVGDEFAGHVHTGATSQDIIDTSLVLRLRDVATILQRRIAALLGQIGAVRARDGDKASMAHTRMQAALPVTAAHKLDSWSRPLERHLRRLAELGPRLFVLQFGGPVGARGDLEGRGDAVGRAVAARLGLDDAPAWHAERDTIAEFGSWLSLVTGALGKTGQDIALLAQTEIAAVTLAGLGGSSAMPHKQNPVAAEVLVALARLNAGLLGTLHQSLVHENERSGAAWTLEWMVLPQMAVATGAALRIATTLLDGLRFV